LTTVVPGSEQDEFLVKAAKIEEEPSARSRRPAINIPDIRKPRYSLIQWLGKRNSKKYGRTALSLKTLTVRRKPLLRQWDGLVFLNIHGLGQGGLFVAITPDGNPAVSFRNPEGKHVVGIGIGDMGHGISISDAEGYPVCFILVGKDGVPAIKLFRRTSATKVDRLWETPSPKKRRSSQKKSH